MDAISLEKARSITDAWGLSDDQAQQLVDQPDATPQITTIRDALHRIFDFSAEHADAWVSKPNRAFEGRTPLDVMLTGDIEQVRRYVMYHLYNA